MKDPSSLLERLANRIVPHSQDEPRQLEGLCVQKLFTQLLRVSDHMGTSKSLSVQSVVIVNTVSNLKALTGAHATCISHTVIDELDGQNH